MWRAVARVQVIQETLTDIGTAQRRMAQGARKTDTDLTAMSGASQVTGRQLESAIQRVLHEMGAAQCQKVIGPWGEAQARYSEMLAVIEHVRKLGADANVLVTQGLVELEKIRNVLASAGR